MLVKAIAGIKIMPTFALRELQINKLLIISLLVSLYVEANVSLTKRC
nr:MAG TPA: hypothetical protein [Caudoviricetes sp.]